MRKVNFDYANTCPQIDKAIARAKTEIQHFIDDILCDACGLLKSEQREELSIQYAESLYGRIEDVFEETRSANERMRDEADRQISDLKDEIANLESNLLEIREEQT